MTLILLAISAIITFCFIAWHLAIFALPFMVLCGWPHKSIYVASGDMWRTGDMMPFTSKICAKRATY